MNTTNTIIILVMSGLPLGLIIMKFFSKFFVSEHSKLGKVSSICTNVIGSLTKHDLAVRNIYYDDNLISISENNEIELENIESKKKHLIEQSELKNHQTLKLAAVTSALCHYPKISKLEKYTNQFLEQSGFSKNEVISNYQVIAKLSSDKKKKISTVVAKKLETKGIFAFSKGNPYALLKRCQRLQIEDQKIDITPTIRRKLKRRIDKLNKRGQKVIAFAYKGLPKKQYQTYSEEFTENDLILTAIFAFINPINTRVLKSIEKAKENDIKIYVVTGTQEKKATALAIKLGLINPHYFESITGSQIQDLSEKKLSKMLSNKEKDYVFSEMKNSEKQIVFKALHGNGETIALTDKNDEESLNKIMKHILEGRDFHQGYLKCVYLNCTLKIAEIFIVLTALATERSINITLGSILLLELVVNILLGLSLKAEKTKHKLKNSPAKMLTEGIFMGIFVSILYLFTTLQFGLNPGQIVKEGSPIISNSSTVFFVTLAIFQTINAYRIKNSGKSIFSNMHLVLSTIVLALVIYSTLQIKSLQTFFNFAILSSLQWQMIILAIASFLFLQYLRTKLKDGNSQTGLSEN